MRRSHPAPRRKPEAPGRERSRRALLICFAAGADDRSRHDGRSQQFIAVRGILSAHRRPPPWMALDSCGLIPVANSVANRNQPRFTLTRLFSSPVVRTQPLRCQIAVSTWGAELPLATTLRPPLSLVQRVGAAASRIVAPGEAAEEGECRLKLQSQSSEKVSIPAAPVCGGSLFSPPPSSSCLHETKTEAVTELRRSPGTGTTHAARFPARRLSRLTSACHHSTENARDSSASVLT